MLRIWSIVGITSAAILLSTASAFADRPATAEERAKIEAALRAAGYTSWGEIELDDGKWEVDDAIAKDGRKYEVDLNRSYKIIKRERDD